MSLTVAVLTKNAEKTLERSLDSASFADEIVLVDNGSRDNTLEIAKRHTSLITISDEQSFAKRRDKALEMATKNWIFYLDADEIITEELKDELKTLTSSSTTPKKVAYVVKRENHFLKEKMYPDYIERLFYTPTLKGWKGKVHEHAEYQGDSGVIQAPLIHHTHTDITSMLEKTNKWSEMEAQLRIDADHPPMRWWRLIRIAISTFCNQYFGKKLFRFGRAGLFEAYFQMIDKLVVYTKLWEKQKN